MSVPLVSLLTLKSALMFSPSSLEVAINNIKKKLSISIVQGHDLYLGLPTFSLCSKQIQFGYLREIILKKVNG